MSSSISSIQKAYAQSTGSELWYDADLSAKGQRMHMLQNLTASKIFTGNLTGNWSIISAPIFLTVPSAVDPEHSYPAFQYKEDGCYRDDSWPWYLKSLTWYQSVGFIIPYMIALALFHGQSLSGRKTLALMVAIGCVAYAGKLEMPNNKRASFFINYIEELN
jgi:hypothetical protein